MDVRNIVDQIARARGYKRVRPKHYVRAFRDVHHLLHLDKGTWTRTHQLNFAIALDYAHGKRDYDIHATIEEWGAPCKETSTRAYAALSFDSELDEAETRERLVKYFECMDAWMFGFGGRTEIRDWIASHGEYYIVPSFVSAGCYHDLGLPLPTKPRPKSCDAAADDL